MSKLKFNSKEKEEYTNGMQPKMAMSSEDTSRSLSNLTSNFPEEFSVEDLVPQTTTTSLPDPSKIHSNTINDFSRYNKNNTMKTLRETETKMRVPKHAKDSDGTPTSTRSYLPRGRQPEPEPEPHLFGNSHGGSRHSSGQQGRTPGAFSIGGDGQWVVRSYSNSSSHDQEEGSSIMPNLRNHSDDAASDEHGYQTVVEAQTVETASVAEIHHNVPPPSPPILVEATATGCSTKWSTRTIYQSIVLGVLLLVGMIVVVVVIVTKEQQRQTTTSDSTNKAIPTPTVSPTVTTTTTTVTTTTISPTSLSGLEIACQFLQLYDLGQCQSMNTFSSTLVSGTTIPSEIGLLTGLVSLEITQTALIGSIPSTLGNLSLLTFLSLHSNALTGSIPSSISLLTSLTLLTMYDNNLNGSIPPSLTTNLKLLTWLEMGDNALTGSIPSTIGNLSLLTWLSLYSNGLAGSIPSSMDYLVGLRTLYLDSNMLTGSIPSTFGTQLTNLVEFHVGNTSLAGSFPSALCSLASLTSLRIDCQEIQCDCCISRWENSSNFCTTT